MTLNEALKYTVLKLKEANIEDAKFEAKCLLQHHTGASAADLIIGDKQISEDSLNSLNSSINKRISNLPLQYIIGEWEFMGHIFAVGEGVLIPRPETEVLVELALKKIKNIESPVVFDLCSGSGCIGISIAKERPDAKVFLFEKYDKAFGYLTKNAQNINNVVPVQHDITLDADELCLPIPDVIVSNPPYIRSDEMETLQKEVKKEPSTALDGGEDGMDFYRVIAEKWLPKIKSGGAFFVECDPEQADPLSKIFLPRCTKVKSVSDLNGDLRVVCGDIY